MSPPSRCSMYHGDHYTLIMAYDLRSLKKFHLEFPEIEQITEIMCKGLSHCLTIICNFDLFIDNCLESKFV